MTRSASSSTSQEPAKRGRKRKQDEDFEAEDEAAKRKLQNRAAQRAFRERKEKYVHDLEEELQHQRELLSRQARLIEKLIQENQALRRGESVPETPLDPIDYSPSQRPPSLGSASNSPSSVHLAAPEEQKVSPAQIAAQDSTAAATSTPTSQPSLALQASVLSEIASTVSAIDIPSQARGDGGSLEDLASYAMATSMDQGLVLPVTPQPLLPLTPGAIAASGEKSIDIAFDFEAPFDYETLPMPDLYQSFFDPSFFNIPTPGFGLTGSAITAGGSSLPELDRDTDDAEDPDDPECDRATPPPLPGGRLPCNKPECDFSSMSCALPAPWRPASLDDAVAAKDVWVCQTAWAKLCSHPLFEECDVNELCHELRSRTRCSMDGQLVIAKNDVCQVFRSIPNRAKLRRQLAQAA